MQLDFQARELTVKLVYYGPALSGKTTNLKALHALVAPDARGRLMTLDTRDDRTLFYEEDTLGNPMVWIRRPAGSTEWLMQIGGVAQSAGVSTSATSTDSAMAETRVTENCR